MKPLLFCDVDGVLRARDRVRATSGNAHDFDPTIHYDMDGAVRIDRDWLFHYSNEMISIFRDLILNDRVEWVWVTNWVEHATTKLNPLFGFPPTVLHIPLTVDRSDEHQTYKAAGVAEYLTALPEEEQRPFIWLDDVAAAPYLETIAHLLPYSQPHLTIAPEERFGITRQQMQQILEFVG